MNGDVGRYRVWWFDPALDTLPRKAYEPLAVAHTGLVTAYAVAVRHPFGAGSIAVITLTEHGTGHIREPLSVSEDMVSGGPPARTFEPYMDNAQSGANRSDRQQPDTDDTEGD